MSDIVETMPSELKAVYEKKPAWVAREIIKEEALALYTEIERAGAKSAIEIGVASGFSSSVILSALQRQSSGAMLYAFDLAKQCYFDKTKLTGQAVSEIIGKVANYKLTTGVTSADLPASTPIVDFIFIDAGHRHPWPALDLLSLYRFLKPGGVIALHDINLPLQSKGAYRQNGPRDLIRAWLGPKRIYKMAPNIGFVEGGSDVDVFESICRCMEVDWDVEVEEKTLMKYLPIADRFGVHARQRLAAIFEQKKASVERTHLLR
jgi:predicted O-methyltransferase YrrM